MGDQPDLRVFARWFEQTNGKLLTPKLLTAQDVREYRAWPLQRQAAPATINHALTALRACPGWGGKWAA